MVAEKPAAACSVNAEAAEGFASRSCLHPAPAGAIRLDSLEHGAGDPGKAGVAARVARLAGHDRRPENRKVDRAASGREHQRGADLDAACTREAAFEHDAPLAQLRAGGQHGHVHSCATTQAGELHSIGASRRPQGRPQGRRHEWNGRATFGNAREVGDGARVGLRVSEREHVCPVGRIERLLPRIAPARAHLQRQHDRRRRCPRDRDRERARKQTRADARERQPE